MRKRILIVDDDAALLAMLSDTFRARGMDVTACADSACAISRIQNFRFDTALFDLRLPGPGGLELLTRFHRRQPGTPAFVISGNLTPATVEIAEQLGARALEKPFVLASVCDTVTTAAERSSASRPWSILVVDDDPGILHILHTYLSDVGFRVEKASDGAEALDRVRTTPVPFDVALVDINMPHLNGVALIREMERLSPETLPVIMTGEATSRQVQEAYAAGAETMIRKPFQIDAMPQVIESLEVTIQERRARAATKRARAARSTARRCLDGFRDVATAPRGTRAARIRSFVGAAAAAIVLGIVGHAVVAALEASAERQAREQRMLMERLDAALDRRAGPDPAVVSEGAPVASHPMSLDSDQLRLFQGFMQKVEGYLRRDESRELEARHIAPGQAFPGFDGPTDDAPGFDVRRAARIAVTQ